MERVERHKVFYFTIALVGILLMIAQINIYRQTIIPFKIPLSIMLVVTLVGFLNIVNNYRKTYKTRSFFFPFAQSFTSFGFIACYIFMALNYYYADKETLERKFEIFDKSIMGTKSPQPTCKIDYNGIEKQLVFFSTQQKSLDTSHEVILTTKKGLFGFDVFSDMRFQ